MRWLLLLLLLLQQQAFAVQLSAGVFETIKAGRVAVIPDYFRAEEVARLARDAASLYEDGYYSSPTRDVGLKDQVAAERSVLRGSAWTKYELGDGRGRAETYDKLSNLRRELSVGLQRPDLAQGDDEGAGKLRHEVSYTRFSPGASLARHIDEHHEEAKGIKGWVEPTRRSVSWLVYLNKDWTEARGGQLRVFERKAAASTSQVGATGDGDLQVGWLRAVDEDPFDRPVFLDSRRDDPKGGNCALRAFLPGGDTASLLSRDFFADPTLFIATDLPQRLLFLDGALARRYRRLEEVRTPLRPNPPIDPKLYAPRDVLPTAGTLVLFDSVALPHEVLATIGDQPRFALSGWFHQAQQPLHHHL